VAKSGLKAQTLYSVCQKRKNQRLSQMNTLMKSVKKRGKV